MDNHVEMQKNIHAIVGMIMVIVEDRDSVDIGFNAEGDNITLTVTASPSDMGRIIGKQGATITSIRTIMKNIVCRNGKRYFLEVGLK